MWAFPAHCGKRFGHTARVAVALIVGALPLLHGHFHEHVQGHVTSPAHEVVCATSHSVELRPAAECPFCCLLHVGALTAPAAAQIRADGAPRVAVAMTQDFTRQRESRTSAPPRAPPV